MRKGEELKAPRYASAAVTRDYITAHNIIPNTGNSFFCGCHLYIKYCLTSVPILILLTYYCYYNISLTVPKFASCNSLYKYLQTKAYRLLFSKNTKLKRKRKRRKNGYLTKATKALVVSKPIAIFYTGHGKS